MFNDSNQNIYYLKSNEMVHTNSHLNSWSSEWEPISWNWLILLLSLASLNKFQVILGSTISNTYSEQIVRHFRGTWKYPETLSHIETESSGKVKSFEASFMQIKIKLIKRRALR